MQQEIGMPEEGEQFADEDDRNGTKTNGNSHSRYKCSATSKDRWTDSEKQGLYLKWVCPPPSPPVKGTYIKLRKDKAIQIIPFCLITDDLVFWVTIHEKYMKQSIEKLTK